MNTKITAQRGQGEGPGDFTNVASTLVQGANPHRAVIHSFPRVINYFVSLYILSSTKFIKFYPSTGLYKNNNLHHY